MADEADQDGSERPAAPARRPYSTPDIAWDKPLDDRPNLISACAQRPGEDDACNASPFS
jgi:hypothetical protein